MPKRSFRTSSFYLAAFLYASGGELISLDRIENQRRAEFVFKSSTELERVAHDFDFAPENSGAAVVDARKLIYAIKTLKDKLYQR